MENGLQITRRALVVGGTAAALAPGEMAMAEVGWEAELLDALDLARPELAAVKEARATQGDSAALAALAKHLRSRRNPKWDFDPAAQISISAGERDVADRATRHEFESVGIWHTFHGKIDWAYNPTTQPGSPHAADHEWTWQLNRHGAWAALARACAATGDPRYGRELAQQIGDWIRENPPPSGKADQAPFSRWRTIEAGIRMFSSWPHVYLLMVRRPDVFPDDVLLSMVDCMRRHADYLDSYPTSGNWLCMEANGEYHVGVLFPEFRNAAYWRESALGRLRREVDAQVYPDGCQIELTPGYHNVSLSNFVEALRLAKANRLPVPDGYQAPLQRMYDMNLGAMSPDRDVPPYNDSWHVDVPHLLADGLALFPKRADWRWIAAEGKEGKAPGYTSRLFPYAGWAVMRSGWERNARFLMMDCGPFGYGHQHEDKLSFVVHAYGSRLVFDAGSYAYDASELRRYVLSARGHNVIHIDGLEQNRRGGPRYRFVSKTPARLEWQTTAAYDYVEAAYGSAEEETWGPKRLQDVTHTRRVLFVKPDYWIVVDTLVPSDAAEHTYESTFHLDSPEAAIEGSVGSRRVITRNPQSANLAVIPVDDAGLDIHIVQGQEKPFLQGWLPNAHALTGAQPRPCVYFTRKAAGPVHFTYAFVPSAPGHPGRVTNVMARYAADDAVTVETGMADGSRERATLGGTHVRVER